MSNTKLLIWGEKIGEWLKQNVPNATGVLRCIVINYFYGAFIWVTRVSTLHSGYFPFKIPTLRGPNEPHNIWLENRIRFCLVSVFIRKTRAYRFKTAKALINCCYNRVFWLGDKVNQSEKKCLPKNFIILLYYLYNYNIFVDLTGFNEINAKAVNYSFACMRFPLFSFYRVHLSEKHTSSVCFLHSIRRRSPIVQLFR